MGIKPQHRFTAYKVSALSTVLAFQPPKFICNYWVKLWHWLSVSVDAHKCLYVCLRGWESGVGNPPKWRAKSWPLDPSHKACWELFFPPHCLPRGNIASSHIDGVMLAWWIFLRMERWHIIMLILFFGCTIPSNAATIPGSVLEDQSWWCLGEHACLGSEQVCLHAKPILQLGWVLSLILT